ncbi:hypothetical protein EF906_18475 [Streptomyces sp. WAC08241]|nr:hypothetical protein EF906_18475 [Streptomyces sp. WAC08241]
MSTQAYAAPVFPCACGSPVAPPVAAGAVAEPITHRNWTDAWVTVRCGACGREDDWPHPELGCQCGAVLRVPVRTADGPGAPDAPDASSTPGAQDVPDAGPHPGATPPRTAGPGASGRGPGASRPDGPHQGFSGTDSGRTDSGRTDSSCTDSGRTDSSRTGSGGAGPQRPGVPPRPKPYRPFAERYPAHVPPPPAAPHPAPVRGAFRPVTIRTGRDAVAAAAGYLRWLGFRDVVQPEERPPSGVDLRAPGLVAQVDPSTRPTGPRAVECLWLNGLSDSATSVFFSLAGYTPEARARAAEIGLPLFVLDLTGTPQPVNRAADGLAASGA